jgi:cytoskeletal protein RodZ
MSAVGQQLRSSRKAQNLSERDVAEITKLRADHVLAVEDGNYDVFPARVYLRGFVRTYARLLKLDVDQVLKDLDVELESSTTHRDPPALLPRNKGIADAIMFQLSRINWKIMAPLIVLFFLVLGTIWGIRSWKEASARDPLANLPEGVYRPTNALPVELLPLPGPALTNR